MIFVLHSFIFLLRRREIPTIKILINIGDTENNRKEKNMNPTIMSLAKYFLFDRIIIIFLFSKIKVFNIVKFPFYIIYFELN
jgi:hypothetical protein